MLSTIVVAVSATVSYVMAVFSAFARAARLPMLATLTRLADGRVGLERSG